ncbi:hypothetical protein [Lutibacter sp.]
MKLKFTLIFALVSILATAQFTEKQLDGVEFLQMEDGSGGTIYGFTKGKIVIGPNFHIRGDGSRIYLYYDNEGITQGFGMAEVPSTGLMKLFEREDNIMHGKAFQMTGNQLNWAQIYKNGKIKKITEIAYTSKLSNRKNCIGNCIDGFGMFQTSDEQLLFGYFKGMQPITPVIHVFKSGSMYQGAMKKWEREGFGKYKYSSDGSYYIGMWKKNKRHGLGIWFNKDGSIYKKGYFKKDELKINM